MRGIGIDIVQISEMARLIEDAASGRAFLEHTFTTAERAEAYARVATSREEYFAGRFAAKEAVFKALASRLPDVCCNFDLRHIETLTHPSGAPVARIREEAGGKELLEGLTALRISLSHDGDYAVAIAEAE